MSFEDQFPSLKGEEQKHTNCTLNYSDGNTDFMDECEVFYKGQILEHCLDKQRVREAIERLEKKYDLSLQWSHDAIPWDEIKKELGI